jgi:hypothetical protein
MLYLPVSVAKTILPLLRLAFANSRRRPDLLYNIILSFTLPINGLDCRKKWNQMPESDEDDSESKTESTDNEQDDDATPTTRRDWKMDDHFCGRKNRVSVTDPNQVFRSAATSKSKKREYYLWHSQVERSMGSRTMCWMGSTSFKSRVKTEHLRGRCFVCKLDFETG